MENKKNTLCVGKLIKVRPEYEERYVIIHKHVWPEVLERIYKSNIRNYSIFMLDGILFSFNEYVGNNYEDDMNTVDDSVTRDWWKLTDPMQEPLSTIIAGEWWADAEQIQHFDEIQKDYSSIKRKAYTAEIKPESESLVKNHFKELDNSLYRLFNQSNIQNHTSFMRDNNLYIYFEYYGSDFQKDDKALNSDTELSKWNSELENYLNVSWKEMLEVFHTN